MFIERRYTLSVYWELPLDNGYRYVSQTVCLAGTNASNQSGRAYFDGDNLKRLRNPDGSVVTITQWREMDLEVKRRIQDQVSSLDVRYIMLDMKRFAEREPGNLMPNSHSTRNIMFSDWLQVDKDALYKIVRKKLKFFRKVVEQTPWMKEFIKIDVIRMRIYSYTNVPCDQWFNGVSIIKNCFYNHYEQQVNYLLGRGLNEANACKMVMSWYFGTNIMTNRLTDVRQNSNSDMMLGHTPSMTTTDIRNIHRGVIYPYGKNLRKSGGYPKFGNSLNRPLHVEFNHRHWIWNGERRIFSDVEPRFNMWEMFHTPIQDLQPIDRDAIIVSAPVDGYSIEMQEVVVNSNNVRLSDLLTREQSFNRWIEILLEEQGN